MEEKVFVEFGILMTTRDKHSWSKSPGQKTRELISLSSFFGYFSFYFLWKMSKKFFREIDLFDFTSFYLAWKVT